MPLRAVLIVVVVIAVSAAPAYAEPGSGPRQTVDQTFTTTHPGSPTGIGYEATFHGEGDPTAPPPPMDKMTFYPPAGFRFDTSVPDQCTATDAELQVRGPDACPPGSILGVGRTDGLFMAPVTHSFVFHEFTHRMFIANNAGEQIILVEAEGYAVMRGKFQPDGSLEVKRPPCFPQPPTGECVDDYILETMTSSFIPPYTRATADGVRSYATTPPECPKSRYWNTTIKFWWSDGAEDTVVTLQPCTKR